MNDKIFFSRDEDKTFREFIPLQEVLNAGASFVGYEPFIDESSVQSYEDGREENRHVE